MRKTKNDNISQALACIFRDHPITAVPFEGDMLITVAELERAWDYAPFGLSKQIARWVEQGLVVDGVHFMKLAGQRLAAFKKVIHFSNCEVDPKAAHLLTVTKRGLYRLLTIIPDKAIAVAFQDWLETEVLPAIEKTGSYSVPGTESRQQSMFTDRRDMKELRLLAADLRRAGDHVRSRRVLAHVADLVAHEPNVSPSTSSARKSEPVQPEKDDIAERAIRAVWAWMNQFAARFAPDARIGPASQECFGRWARVADEWDDVAIVPYFLERLLRKEGFRPKEVIDAWLDLGWMIHGEGSHVNKQVRIAGRPQRCIVICRGAFLSSGAMIETAEA